MPDDSPDDPHEIENLLIHRELARRNYRDFLRYHIKVRRLGIQWNWHIEYLADVMQAVTARQLRRTIINIPPRFWKSTIISQLWQAWMIGRSDTPTSSVFSAAATAFLAARDSRKTLDCLRADWYQAIFPGISLVKENEVEWSTAGGAERNAAGTDGTVTGRGGDHVIWDDLLLANEAMSETIREKKNEWLGETLRSRVNDLKTGTITGIMQRVHERDPTGYLLEQMRVPGADQYTHIIIPNEAPRRTVVEFQGTVYATREQGDLLHPARMGPEEVAATKAAMRNNYEGQYNQNPIKMEGGHLDPRRLIRLKGSALELKSMLGLTPVFYIDFAATEKQTQKNDPDFSCVLVGARDQLGRLIILDVWRRQTADYSVIARTVIHMHKLWRPRFVKGERGALLNLFQPVLRQQMKLIGHFLTLEPLAGRRQDKVERSMPLQGMLNAGIVGVPENAPWLDNFTTEMRGFPNAAHDDQLDPAFDLANDFDTLPQGNAPTKHPDDERILANEDMHRRIEKARQAMLNPPVDDDGTGW